MSKNTNNSLEEELKIRFSKRLIKAMGEDSNLSFSKKCGISDSLLGRYLKCETFPTISKLQLISKASGRSMGWLLGECDDDEYLQDEDAPTLSKEELLKWWGLIFESLDDGEKQSIIQTYQRFGVSALFADVLATVSPGDKEILRRDNSVDNTRPTSQISTDGKKAG